jgi:adenylate cyclase
MEKKDFTILYVDDEQQNLVSFNATFRREYKIITALSGQEGINIMKNNDIQLVITDQRMPGMTGIQFLENILPEWPDTIRMILTGFSDVEAIIAAINSGRVFRYITKPWEENELRMTIENARQLYDLQVSNKSLVYQLQQKVEEQEKTLRLFMKYVPEPVVQKTLKATEDSLFDGEIRQVSVLFCDIRGFTPMSEVLSPKQVVAFLNDYYSMMTAIVKKYNGYVTQYVGDEIFATFGAPIEVANKEKNAVFCALDMMEKLKNLNKKYKKLVQHEIKMGIGINSGEVIAGNLGSEERIDYALTGDTVNTGKRIEMITKEYPNSILISEPVYKNVKDLIRTKDFGAQAVKGKKEKVKVHEVLGKMDSNSK